MPEVIIDDVPINFPYQNPYNVQRKYMEKVIECLKESKNGVLESPTGTGKTLSLLCSSLAWLQQKKEEAEILEAFRNSESQNDLELTDKPSIDSISVKLPKIIYASRTHTQLTQVIKELKGTSYSYMKVGVFASRDQLCIHPELSFENNVTKSEMCKSKTKKRLDAETDTYQCECSYFEQYQTLHKSETFQKTHFDNKILDVEDLRTSGQDHHFCPYYMSRTLIDDADIVFMPYNYLLDPKIREFIVIELNDAVVILDEAHNVPQVCEDSASIEFKSSNIAEAIVEVKNIASFINDNRHDRTFQPTTFNPSELIDLQNILLRFGKAIDDIQIAKAVGNSLPAAEFDGDFIFTIMENADIAYHTSMNIATLITNALEYVSNCINLLRLKENEGKNRSEVKLSNQSPGLRTFKNILWTTFPNCGEDFREDIKKHYRVYAAYDKSPVLNTNGPVKIVNYWCFSPKFALEHLLHKKHVRSIIFTSGTISPLQPFITALGISIHVQLQNAHIIDPCQVLVEIISHGPDSEELFSNFQNRSNPKYLHSLGATVLKFCEVIPNGLLIFFPSYIILNLCRMSWQNKGIWSQIEKIKPIFVEPKMKDEFTNTMKKYYKQINNATMNGAIFMAVCRGKVSEGLDFADVNGRAVIITGLPFPPVFDPKVRLKKNYMQKNCTTRNESLSGDEWYQLEASRAINQAIGRVIRHRHDYGAILLCDCRFDKAVQKRQLPKWIQRHIRIGSSRRSFDAITESISQFFQAQRMKLSSAEATSMLPMPADNPISVRIGSNEENSTSHDFENRLLSVNELNDNDQSTISGQGISESPITRFARQIALLPLSSPSSTNSSTLPSPSSSSNVHSNGTPRKQKCTINLSQRFDDEN